MPINTDLALFALSYKTNQLTKTNSYHSFPVPHTIEIKKSEKVIQEIDPVIEFYNNMK